MATVCAECRHMWMPDKRAPWYYWACRQVPAPSKMNHVTGIMGAPWHLCREVNGGECPMFEAGPNRLRPDAGLAAAEKVMEGK